MEQADLIWHNGELVAWEDAKVHVLTHGLHYGTGVFEGERAYETAQGPAIFRHHDHLERLFKSAELYYMPIPYTLEELRAATHELIAANELRECYIRPIVFRGYGQMGLYPLDAPVDVSIAVWPWGAYLGEEGKRQRRPRQGLELAADPARRADPARQGVRPVPQQRAGEDRGDEGRLPGGDPARLARVRVRGLAARTSTCVRDGTIVTPPQTAGILDGISRKSIIQIAARPRRSRSIERDLARAELYLADEVFLSGTAAELVPVREIDDHAIGERRAGPGHARAPARVRRRAARPRSALRRLARRRPGAVARRFRAAAARLLDDQDRAVRHHPARRHAGRGHVAVRAGEAARRAPARRARDRPDRGRLPELEPQGARAVRAARARALRQSGRFRVRDDPAPRGRRRSGRRAARAGRLLRAGMHARRQDLGAAPREGGQGRPRGEPADDRGVGRVPGRPGQAGRVRRRALLRRLRRRPARTRCDA